MKQTAIKSISSVFLSEFPQDFIPSIFLNSLSSELFIRRLGNASTARNTSLTVNRNILIVVNWNIISNFSRSSNQSLIINRNGELMLQSVILLHLLYGSLNFFVLFEAWGCFIKLYLNMFFGDVRSNYILFEVKVTRFFDSLFSHSFLHNCISNNWFSLRDSVFSISELNFEMFSFENRLNHRLVDEFVGGDFNFDHVNLMLSLSRFDDWFECLTTLSSFYNS